MGLRGVTVGALDETSVVTKFLRALLLVPTLPARR
jgi:hypothetical protein